jgi:hypothetical protein
VRFRLRSSSADRPPVLIQLDASSSEDPSKISSGGVHSSTAQTDQIAARVSSGFLGIHLTTTATTMNRKAARLASAGAHNLCIASKY